MVNQNLITFNQPIGEQKDIAGGGVLLDQGIHMVDLIRLFGGDFNVILILYQMNIGNLM